MNKMYSTRAKSMFVEFHKSLISTGDTEFQGISLRVWESPDGKGSPFQASNRL